MQVNVNETNSLLRKIRVQVDPEELAAIEEKVVRSIQKRAEVPGFRKGKVPLNIVRKRYADTIKQEVLEQAVSDTYFKALQESKLNVVSEGRISDLQFESVQKGLEYEIEVEIAPEVELRRYKGLRVEKERMEVTDQQVEEFIQRLREQTATVREAEEVKEGHLVTVDIQELGEGDVPVIGRKHEDVRIKIGAEEFDPDFEKQLIGARAGEQRIIRREAPPRPEAKEQTPAIESYAVTIKKIEEIELPPLDDELARSTNIENVNTLEELRAWIREQLQEDLEDRIREQVRQRLVDELLKENPFDVPESMVEHYLEHVVEDIRRKHPNEQLDEEFIRQQYRPIAIHNIRWYFLKYKIAEAENLEVTREELDRVLQSLQIPEQNQQDEKTMERLRDRIAQDLLEQKVLEFLESNAEIIEISPQEASNLDVS